MKDDAFLGVTFNGNVTFNGPMYDIHDNHHIHFETKGNKPQQVSDDDGFEYVDFKFFDQSRFDTMDKQFSLRSAIKRIIPKIDVDNGRDWIAVYIAYHYYIGREFIMLGYADFFSDIEALLPGVLTKINKEAENGDKRYKNYTVLLLKECRNWFIVDECLPPMCEWKSIRFNYGVDQQRQNRIQNLVSDIYKRLKLIDLW